MRPSELESLLRERLDPEATIKDMTDNGGFGLVRWSRPRDYIIGGQEHIVHRWATVDTDGTLRWPEGHFYSGGYYDDDSIGRVLCTVDGAISEPTLDHVKPARLAEAHRRTHEARGEVVEAG